MSQTGVGGTQLAHFVQKKSRLTRLPLLCKHAQKLKQKAWEPIISEQDFSYTDWKQTFFVIHIVLYNPKDQFPCIALYFCVLHLLVVISGHPLFLVCLFVQGKGQLVGQVGYYRKNHTCFQQYDDISIYCQKSSLFFPIISLLALNTRDSTRAGIAVFITRAIFRLNLF